MKKKKSVENKQVAANNKTLALRKEIGLAARTVFVHPDDSEALKFFVKNMKKTKKLLEKLALLKEERR